MSKFLYFDFYQECDDMECFLEDENYRGFWVVDFLGQVSFSSKNFKSPESESIDDSWKVSDEGWVVWTNYSTGDSFGRSYCDAICIVDVFRNYEEAVTAGNAVWDGQTKYIKEGKEHKIYSPWDDYFANLETVKCSQFKIT